MIILSLFMVILFKAVLCLKLSYILSILSEITSWTSIFFHSLTKASHQFISSVLQGQACTWIVKLKLILSLEFRRGRNLIILIGNHQNYHLSLKGVSISPRLFHTKYFPRAKDVSDMYKKEESPPRVWTQVLS